MWEEAGNCHGSKDHQYESSYSLEKVGGSGLGQGSFLIKAARQPPQSGEMLWKVPGEFIASEAAAEAAAHVALRWRWTAETKGEAPCCSFTVTRSSRLSRSMPSSSLPVQQHGHGLHVVMMMMRWWLNVNLTIVAANFYNP